MATICKWIHVIAGASVVLWCPAMWTFFLWVKFKVFAVGCYTELMIQCYLLALFKTTNRKAKNTLTTDSCAFGTFIFLTSFFCFSFTNLSVTPSMGRPLLSGCQLLWSLSHPTTSPRKLNHAWPRCITRSQASSNNKREGENRREGCYPSPTAMFCTVDQWSVPAFIS